MSIMFTRGRSFTSQTNFHQQIVIEIHLVVQHQVSEEILWILVDESDARLAEKTKNGVTVAP